jgi:tetratricopeptide (TPR) repeat protein
MLYCGILAHYAYSLGRLGEFDAGLPLVEKASRFAEQTGRFYALATAEVFHSRILLARGEGKAAVEHIETVKKITEQLGWLNMLWLVPSLMGQACLLQGDVDEARSYFERRTDSYHYMISWKYCGLGECDLAMGDLEAARANIEKSIELAKKSGERAQEGRSLLVLGRIKGKSGPAESSKAEETIVQGMKILEELQIKPWQAEGLYYLGELYAGSGENKKALERLQQALEMFRQMNMNNWTNQVDAVLKSLSPG